jgi:hypothetical protein
VRLVRTTMQLTVWDSARPRGLPFSHDTHGAVACAECHRTAITLAPNRECRSCHVPHHRPQATCTTCHVPAPTGVHRENVHLSCAGSGCHDPAVAPAAAASRTLCLTCHAQQVTHEPGRACAGCHRIPGVAP